MPVKRRIPYSDGVFFITFTCFDWIPLFQLIEGYDIVYKWFDQLKARGHYIIGYQIMPNHVHVLIGFANTGININYEIGQGKRFMAYEMVNRLKKNGKKSILDRMAAAVHPSDRLRGKKHEVWQNSFDRKHCYGDRIILQKLNYMHNNPCTGKWQLVKSPVDYVHSSARFYISDEQGIYPVLNYMELADIDLSRRLTKGGTTSPR